MLGWSFEGGISLTPYCATVFLPHQWLGICLTLPGQFRRYEGSEIRYKKHEDSVDPYVHEIIPISGP